MILQKVRAMNSIDSRAGHLIDLVPPPPQGVVFKNFNKVEQVRAVRPGDQVELVVLPINVDDPHAAHYRDQLRHVLGNMTVELTYTDIYETRFPEYGIKLAWFLRHSTRDAG
jgi:hypothetical protein